MSTHPYITIYPLTHVSTLSQLTLSRPFSQYNFHFPNRLTHSIALASTISMDSLDRRKREPVEAPMITHIAPEAAEYVHPARIKRLENMSSAAFTTVSDH